MPSSPRQTVGDSGGVSGSVAWATIRDFGFNIKEFGATGNGTTNDTAAIQAAHDALPTTGGILFAPAGDYYMASGVTFSKPVTLVGAGGILKYDLTAITRFKTDSRTVTPFTVTANGCTFERFALINTAVLAPTAGAGILVSAAGNFTRLRDIDVVGFYDNVHFNVGYMGSITGCLFSDHVRYGVFVQNTDYNDDGQWAFLNNNFSMISTARTADAHFRAEGGGEYRITACKFNGGTKANGAYPGTGKATISIDVEMPTGVATSDLIVTGSSIENSGLRGIKVTQAGTGAFTNIAIVGNQFASNGNAIWLGAASDETKIAGATVSANTFSGEALSIFAQYMQSLHVGINQHLNAGSTIIQLGVNGVPGSSPTGATVEPQNVAADGVYVYTNQGWAGPNTHGPYTQARHTYEREIPVCTSTTNYVTLYRIQVADYQAGQLEVDLTGAINTVGSAMCSTRWSWAKEAGAITVTKIGTDVTAGAVFDYLIDATSVADEIQIKVRLNAGVGGSDLCGWCRLAFDGLIKYVKKGA